MRVFAFNENEVGFVEINNTLEAEQKFVGGLIEVVAIAPGLDLVCNEEGKFNGSKPVVAWVDGEQILDVIFGNCFVCRNNEEGEFISIKDTDVDIIKEKLKPVIAIVGNRIYLSRT